MKGRIFEIDEATQRGSVQCTEERVLMSNLRIRRGDDLELSSDMVGRPVTFRVEKFGDDYWACEIQFTDSAVLSDA